jgi:hypothetical protein
MERLGGFCKRVSRSKRRRNVEVLIWLIPVVATLSGISQVQAFSSPFFGGFVGPFGCSVFGGFVGQSRQSPIEHAVAVSCLSFIERRAAASLA